KPDWWALTEVARRMGYAEQFTYKTAHEIFQEHARLSGYENRDESNKRRDFDIAVLADIDAISYENFEPIQWPVQKNGEGKFIGTTRMFMDGNYFTANRKARFVSVESRLPVNETSSEYPLILNTGRCRDQWHTMTRTGKSPRLSEHDPEPYLDIYPTDALRKQIFDGELVTVDSKWGKAIVRARVSKATQPGSVFMPMHWNEQFSSHGRVDAVVNPVCDPVSGQPELKHTPVNVKKYEPAWHGFLLSRRQLSIEDSTYWVKAIGKKFYRYELAGEQQPDAWSLWSRQILCETTDDVNWVEYLDASARRYRGARLIGNRIESCIFIGPTHDLPSRSWLSGLFKKEELTEQERVSLLTGKPPKGEEDQGRVVCACFSVGEKTILNAIKEKNLTTVDAIGECLQAGTNCGSCIPELKNLLR
ncbi:molybdopterin dinucleotide binding domain-containing protein, partial [Kaarinaea lacus]